MQQKWHRIKNALIPLDEVGGVVLFDRGEGKGWQISIMLPTGVLPVVFGAAEHNEAVAAITELHTLLNEVRDW